MSKVVTEVTGVPKEVAGGLTRELACQWCLPGFPQVLAVLPIWDVDGYLVSAFVVHEHRTPRREAEQ